MTTNLEKLVNDVFHGNTEGKINAAVNFKTDDWRLYSASYLYASKVMISEVLKTNCKNDLLIYPILFCIRHHLELSFKYFICLINKKFDCKPQFIKDHNLEKLWLIIKNALKKSEYFKEQLDSDFIKQIDTVVNLFNDYDVGSFTFRYPVVPNENTDSAFRNLKCISYDKLEELHGEIATIFEVFGLHLEHLGDQIIDFKMFQESFDYEFSDSVAEKDYS
jgi:hypothetical protein